MTSLDTNDLAPVFSLPASNGETVSLKSFRGKWVVLYFYPRDNTPGCTKEACAFRDNRKEFEKKNAVVLGVSPDSIESHQKFIKKFQLPFLLLADTEKEVAKAFGVYDKKSLYGRIFFGIIRSTFLIDPTGKIAKIWRKVKVAGHEEEVLESIS